MHCHANYVGRWPTSRPLDDDDDGDDDDDDDDDDDVDDNDDDDDDIKKYIQRKIRLHKNTNLN